MKKIVVILIILSAILHNVSLVTYAQIEDFDYYEVLDNHGSAMIVTNSQTGNVLHANREQSNFYGYKIEQLKSISLLDLNTLTPDRTLIEDKERMLIIALLSMIILLLVISFLLFKNSRKLKAQNNEINNLNELRQAFMDANESMVFLKDENLKYVFTNKEFEKFNDEESSKIIGYDDFDLLDEELATLYKKIDLEVLDKKTVIVNEMEWENRIHRTTKFPVKLVNGHYGIGAYVQDVTEEYNNKRKLEEINDMLNKSNNLLLAILESSPEVIVFALDANYCYISFNKKHKKVINQIWGKEIEIGMSMLEAIGDDDYIKAKENFDRALAGESFSLVEDYGDEQLSRLVWKNYYSPIYSNDNEIIGLTCFVLNITDRVKAEEEIAYLSYRDSLTGLYNRRFFEDELSRLDIEKNLPISIIVGDMNDLKLTNDIFGHASGDLLLQKAAEVFKKVCRNDDVIARVGGDEFTILLPKTKPEEAEGIISRIKNEFSKVRIKCIRSSMSMGCYTKFHVEEDIMQVLETAEQKMYSIKTIERNKTNSATIRTIIESLHKDSVIEEKHSNNVSRICERLGNSMGLSESEMRRLKEAAYLHDIGKIVLDNSLLNKNKTFTDEEKKAMKHHAVIGYRILNSFDETIDLAEAILAHHERWDGTGYPKGLKGEEIPKLARIIAVAESYDFMTNRRTMNREEAVQELKKQSGIKFDPEVVDIFIEMIRKSKE